MKNIQNIMDLMEGFAPIKLKEDFDNVGLMVGDANENVRKVLLALDCTDEVIEEAIVKNCELIITHHPLIFRKPNRIIEQDLLGSKIIKLIKNNIAVYSSHTNLDSVENGINDTLVEMLGFKDSKIIDEYKGEENCGIGRIISLDTEIDSRELIKHLKNILKNDYIRGHIGKEKIKTIAIINGSGTSYFEEAYKLGADCIITGDTSYHYISDYKELGVTILDADHFNTEWLVFLEVMKKITKEFNDVEFIESEKTENPYEIF